MRRVFALMIVVAIVVASCGGGEEEETTPTPAPAPAADSPSTDEPVDATPQPTVSPAGSDAGTNDDPDGAEDPPPGDTASPDPGAGVSTDFCEFISGIDAAQDSIGAGLDAESFRAAMEESTQSLRRARDLAPPEVADDVQYAFDTFLDIVALFEEYEWNLLAVGSNAADDPRLSAFDEARFAAALDRIGAFCGLDLNDGNGDDTDPGETAGRDAPGDIPTALVPPDVVESFDMGGGTFFLSTSLPFDDVVVFYTDALGDPFFVDQAGQGAVWNTTVEGTMTSVAISAGNGTVEVLISSFG